MTSSPRAEVDVLAGLEPLDVGTADLIGDLVRFALHAEGQNGDWSIAIVLTSDAALRALHREFMGIDTETDVMTFPSEPEPGAAGHGGDIVISMERAADYASAAGHSARREVCFLAVHGTLHLCGWSDATDDERARMLARQDDILAEWEQARAASL